MGLVDAGNVARLDRHIGYYAPYARSHEALDALARCVKALRAGQVADFAAGLVRPRPK